MSRVLIGNLPPGTTIRNIDDFCSPYGRLLYVDVKIQGSATLACVEYENLRNALNLVRSRNGYNFNGYNVQLKLLDDSGHFEVRDDERQQNLWSNNSSQVFNNGMQGPSSYNYGGNNRGGNNNYNNDSGSMLDNSLDFNDTCRIVYDRFLQQGYNRQVAKEKTLEFVSNLQRRSGQQSFNNSNYFGSDQDMMINSSSSFGGNNNQSWSSGNNYDNGGSQMYSNWGDNFNDLNDLQMSQSWGGYNNNNNGGGMSYPRGSNFSGAPSGRSGYRGDISPAASRRNTTGGNRNVAPTANKKMEPAKSGFEYERYIKSLDVRKKIEARIKNGNKASRDLRNLQFHNNIIAEYERNIRQQKQKERQPRLNADEQTKLQRYKSALGMVLKYKKTNQAKLTQDEKKALASNKAIVDEYEKSIAAKGKPNNNNKGPTPNAIFERKKRELIKQSKLNYPYDFRLSGAAKKKMRMLTVAGIDQNEAKHLALHSSNVVNELIQLKKSIPKTVDRTKQLVAFKTGGGDKKGPAKGVAAADISAKKLKAGYKSANKVLRKHETSDISKLTDKEKAIIRISLKRLRSYNLTEGKPLPTTRFDFLLEETDQKPVSKTNKANESSENKKSVKEATTKEEEAEDIANDEELVEEVGDGEEEEPADAVDEGDGEECGGDEGEAEAEEAEDDEQMGEEDQEEQ